MKRTFLLIIALIISIVTKIQADDPAPKGLNFENMPTNKTIHISQSGLDGTVWMGSDDNWQVATDPALYENTLSGQVNYSVGHVGQGSGGTSGNIGFGIKDGFEDGLEIVSSVIQSYLE